MTVNETSWKKLGEYLRESQILGSIQNTLYWDQNTSMPRGAAAWRGEQLSLLAKQLHERHSSNEYADLLAEARQEWNKNDDSEDNQARGRNLDLLEHDFRRQQSLDPLLITAIATAKVKGYQTWQLARAESDFSQFAPALQSLIDLRQEQAHQLSEPRSCWETLAQPFEPDLCLERLNEIFKPLREILPQIVDKVKGSSSLISSKWDISEESQQELCNQLLIDWGCDKSITTLAHSPHPFSITLGPADYRITTRFVSGQPLSAFLATAHEWGHSLYEQGLPDQSHQWFSWPLGQATSMAVHESQSLFWENRVARSFSFSKKWWKRFAAVGAPVVKADDLWRKMNSMAPSLNRVEADELSYGMHILIRMDLEIALLEQGLAVVDLPMEWNNRYKELLGICPKNDAEGCLQDVHWSEGLFGYFPSYLLGHLISAQLSDAMKVAIGAPEEHVARGDVSPMLDWLRVHVFSVGRSLNAEQLVEQVTGKSLSSDSFLHYLEIKLGALALI